MLLPFLIPNSSVENWINDCKDVAIDWRNGTYVTVHQSSRSNEGRLITVLLHSKSTQQGRSLVTTVLMHAKVFMTVPQCAEVCALMTEALEYLIDECRISMAYRFFGTESVHTFHTYDQVFLECEDTTVTTKAKQCGHVKVIDTLTFDHPKSASHHWRTFELIMREWFPIAKTSP